MTDADGLVTTDEAILDSIGEGDESTSTDGTEEEDTGTATDIAEATPPADSQQGTDGGNEAEQPARSGGPQDLVDANGNVIAAGGKERRFYETAHREKARADTAAREVESLKGQLKAITDAGTVGTQFGLSPEEVTTGAQLIASYKTNPVQTIQYMLTQAQANGHNADGIVNGSGMDMGAVKAMLDNALAPLVGDRQAQLESQAARDKALGLYNEFSVAHPDAKVHENSLARLLEDDPNLSPEAAYYKLRSFYLERNLDWTKPIETLQQQAAAKPGGVVTQPQPPDGGGVSPGNVTDTSRVADVSVSTDDIIRQAMAEAGVTD